MKKKAMTGGGWPPKVSHISASVPYRPWVCAEHEGAIQGCFVLLVLVSFRAAEFNFLSSCERGREWKGLSPLGKP